MTARRTAVFSPSPVRGLRGSWVLRLVEVALLGVLPAVTLIALFATAVDDDSVATDFGQFYAAAEAILRGDNPFAAGEATAPWGGPFPYPPLGALLAIPLTPLPLQGAGLLVMTVLVLVALAIPFVLGVRDWRCYGLLLLWPPVISAIQTANVTLWLALACAVAWRFRVRIVPPSASLGAMLAVKFFLWPTVVWLAVTHRLRTAALACVAGAGLVLLSWAPLRFAGLSDYPTILRDLERTVGEDSYTAYIVGLDLGLPSPVARAVWLALGLALVCALIVVARRGDERSSFVLAIAAALALTPIVWLHYFALLLVVVALAQPRLGVLWFVPLGMAITPGSGHPSPFETAATLTVAAVTIAVALWMSSRFVQSPGYAQRSRPT